jgi:hypothetical protein
VLGVLGGLLIWQPFLMGSFYAGVLLIMYLSDVILYRLQNKKK